MAMTVFLLSAMLSAHVPISTQPVEETPCGGTDITDDSQLAYVNFRELYSVATKVTTITPQTSNDLCVSGPLGPQGSVTISCVAGLYKVESRCEATVTRSKCVANEDDASAVTTCLNIKLKEDSVNLHRLPFWIGQYKTQTAKEFADKGYCKTYPIEACCTPMACANKEREEAKKELEEAKKALKGQAGLPAPSVTAETLV